MFGLLGYAPPGATRRALLAAPRPPPLVPLPLPVSGGRTSAPDLACSVGLVNRLPVLSRCGLALGAVHLNLSLLGAAPRRVAASLALRSSLRSSWLPRLMGYGGGWPTCSGCEVEEALPGENLIDGDGCSRHFPFLKASSLALFPSPPSTQIPREISDQGFPESDGVDVFTPFPSWRHHLGLLLLRVDSSLAAPSSP